MKSVKLTERRAKTLVYPSYSSILITFLGHSQKGTLSGMSRMSLVLESFWTRYCVVYQKKQYKMGHEL